MCYMLSGTDPFAKMSEANIVYMITVKNKRPAIPPHVDNDPQKPVFKNMIQQLWHRDPDRRSDFETIVKQLRVHVVDPKLKRRMSRKFLRTLPPLLTDWNYRRIDRRFRLWRSSATPPLVAEY